MTQWLYVLGAFVVVWAVWNYVLRPRVERRAGPVDERNLEGRSEAEAARNRQRLDKDDFWH